MHRTSALFVAPALLAAAVLVLVAAPGRAEGTAPSSRTKILALDLEPIDIERGTATLVTRLVTDALAADPAYEVISQADIRRLVELEADRDLVDCDTESCLAEVAGAMGARFVVFGSVGKLGRLIVVSLSLFDSVEARAVGRQRVEVGSEEELPRRIDAAVAALLGGPRIDAAEASVEHRPSAPSPLLLSGAGAVALGAAAAASGVGAGFWLDSILAAPKSPPDEKQAALDARPLAFAAIAGGAVVVGAGAGLVAWSLVAAE